jgi:hypothetical protein
MVATRITERLLRIPREVRVRNRSIFISHLSVVGPPAPGVILRGDYTPSLEVPSVLSPLGLTLKYHLSERKKRAPLQDSGTGLS